MDSCVSLSLSVTLFFPLRVWCKTGDIVCRSLCKVKMLGAPAQKLLRMSRERDSRALNHVRGPSELGL